MEVIIKAIAIFDTHGQDTSLNCRSGQLVSVIRPLTSKEANDE